MESEEEETARHKRIYYATLKLWEDLLNDFANGYIKNDKELYSVVNSLVMTTEALLVKVYGKGYVDRMKDSVYTINKIPETNAIRKDPVEHHMDLEKMWKTKLSNKPVREIIK